MSKSVISSLEIILAETFALALKTQGYHWNVEGERFSQLHSMFEEQYDALFEAVDEIAERIRALGAKAPSGLTQFSGLSGIADGDNGLDENGMIADLMEGHELLASHLKALIELAGDARDSVTEDMMIARLTEHDKTAWMLRASLPKA